MSNKIIPMASALILSASIAAADVPKVVADIAPVHSLVSKVMNGVGRPKLIIPAINSPHEYQLKPSNAKDIEDANIIFWIGEDLTPWLTKALSSLGEDATKIELLDVDGINLLDFR